MDFPSWLTTAYNEYFADARLMIWSLSFDFAKNGVRSNSSGKEMKVEIFFLSF